MNQVLINLLDNAIKFTREGGVRLEVLELEDRRTEDTVWVQFKVCDTGKGISPENLDKVFGKFQQENSSTRRVHGGTGLGLAISKQLVELQGGQIDCQSEVGVGTTFVVNMPFAYEPRAQVEGGFEIWTSLN